MRIVFTAALIFCVAQPAFAETPMPQYDVEAFCSLDSDPHFCTYAEYVAKELAVSNWSKLPEEKRQECIRADKWGDYRLLHQCIDANIKG